MTAGRVGGRTESAVTEPGQTVGRSGIRPWPASVKGKQATQRFIATYRKAFDEDPSATFCAGELDGITIVVAVGDVGERVQRFVRDELNGKIQRKPTAVSE